MRKGFTMIELMIVIAIIAILGALFFPAIAKVKAAKTYQKVIDGEETTKERRKSLRSFLVDHKKIKLKFEEKYGKLPEGWLTGKIQPSPQLATSRPALPSLPLVEKLPLPTRAEDINKLKAEEINKLKEKIAKLSVLKPFRYEIKIIGSGFISEYSLRRDGKEIMKSKDRDVCESMRKHLKEAQNRGIEIGNSNNNK